MAKRLLGHSINLSDELVLQFPEGEVLILDAKAPYFKVQRTHQHTDGHYYRVNMRCVPIDEVIIDLGAFYRLNIVLQLTMRGFPFVNIVPRVKQE